MEQMRPVVNSITLSLYEITQTDRQRCGVFHHAPKNKVHEEYATDQIINKIQKHKNHFSQRRVHLKWKGII